MKDKGKSRILTLRRARRFAPRLLRVNPEPFGRLTVPLTVPSNVEAQTPAFKPECVEGLTGFEKKVYLAVSKIPRGETRSYKWVAAKTGKPKAYRAVGSALNRNPYIGKVPCHRVIRSDGSIGGFAKGIRRKRELLKAELQ